MDDPRSLDRLVNELNSSVSRPGTPSAPIADWLESLRAEAGSDLYLVAGLPTSISGDRVIRALPAASLDSDDIAYASGRTVYKFSTDAAPPPARAALMPTRGFLEPTALQATDRGIRFDYTLPDGARSVWLRRCIHRSSLRLRCRRRSKRSRGSNRASCLWEVLPGRARRPPWRHSSTQSIVETPSTLSPSKIRSNTITPTSAASSSRWKLVSTHPIFQPRYDRPSGSRPMSSWLARCAILKRCASPSRPARRGTWCFRRSTPVTWRRTAVASGGPPATVDRSARTLMALAAVMTQYLLPKIGGGRSRQSNSSWWIRRAQHIRKNALQHLHQEMTITRKDGSFTIEECLAQLVRRGVLTVEDAARARCIGKSWTDSQRLEAGRLEARGQGQGSGAGMSTDLDDEISNLHRRVPRCAGGIGPTAAGTRIRRCRRNSSRSNTRTHGVSSRRRAGRPRDRHTRDLMLPRDMLPRSSKPLVFGRFQVPIGRT